jgi:hypothetical protein
MGIDAEVAPRARGSAELPDSRGLLAAVLQSSHLNDTACLRFIDPYGETLFNTLQMPVLLEELESLTSLQTD